MSSSGNMDLATVNALSYEDFVDAFGNVVEKCPLVAAAVWSKRPFATLTALEAALGEFIDALPPSGETQATFLRRDFGFDSGLSGWLPSPRSVIDRTVAICSQT